MASPRLHRGFAISLLLVAAACEDNATDSALPSGGGGSGGQNADLGPAVGGAVDAAPLDLGQARADGPASDGAAPSGDARVAAPDGSAPRKIATCYSHCTESIETGDGILLRCDLQDNLMTTCLSDLVCEDGSCVVEGESKPTCENDSQCPEWQACMEGGCYSNCESDADCGEDTQCYRTVCRTRCASNGQACPSGFGCRTSDGTDGICMPVAPPADEALPEPKGAFELSTPTMLFNSLTTTGTFEIRNPDVRVHTFTISKAEHSSLDPDRGRTVETANPLFWVSMGEGAGAARVNTFSVDIDGGESATITISGALNEALSSWTGRLEIRGDTVGTLPLILDFSAQPDGQWTGSLHTFINFEDNQLDVWRESHTSAAARNTKNAFLVQWQTFRESAGRVVTPDEMTALLGSTIKGSWANASTKAACAESRGPNATCYLFAADDDVGPSDGLHTYSDTPTIAVPSGHIEMPFAMNLAFTPGSTTSLSGRVASSKALQYPGNPLASLQFKIDPSTCEDAGSPACLVPVTGFSVTSVVGGRFLSETGDCQPDGLEGFVSNPSPWFVPNFVEGTIVDAADRRIQSECREEGFPLAPTDDLSRARNRSAAGANPIPDGRARTRHLDLVDGVMVNQNTLWLIVRERFDSFLGEGATATSLSAYGIVILQKAATDLKPEDYRPGLLPAVPARPTGLLSLTCDSDLVAEAVGGPLNANNAAALSRILIAGADVAEAQVIDEDSDWEVHYLCRDTGRFDGGRPEWADDLEVDETCPGESRVTYFLVRRDDLANGEQIDEHLCQGAVGCPANGDSCDAAGPDLEDLRGQCADVLANWIEQGLAKADPAWACGDADSAFCEADRTDLREGKDFYEPPVGGFVLTPLLEGVRDAVRYKTRFRTRTGGSIGFVPEVCPDGADLSPYCYDPESIEALRDRIDCLIHIHSTYASSEGFPGEDRTRLQQTLTEQFSGYYRPALVAGQAVPPGGPTEDGFERLYAELLIMLGDDAATRALGSRFDLAGSAIGVFDGDLLEPDGLSLTGGAGYEMRLLYQSTQSYELVLNRFHRLSATLWQIMRPPAVSFVTSDTMTRYLDRVILASTKTAKLAGEKAERYMRFSRADLARGIVERSYTAAYLDGILFSKFLRRYLEGLVGPSQTAQRPQMVLQLENAQLQYSAALYRLRETYDAITDDATVFGFPRGYVPFASLGNFDISVVRVLIQRAQETLRVAREREDRALASTRSFDTDAAEFQSELVRIRNDYENQLAEICGTFIGFDGQVYPAISKYSDQNALATLLGEPCGAMGTGSLYASLGAIDTEIIDTKVAIRNVREIFEKVDIEAARVELECQGRVALGQIEFDAEGMVITLNSAISEARQATAEIERKMAVADRGLGVAKQAVATLNSATASVGACTGVPPIPPSPVACAAGVTAAVGQGVVILAERIALSELIDNNEDIRTAEDDIAAKESEIGNLRRGAMFQAQLQECCLDATAAGANADVSTCLNPGPILVNSHAQVDRLMLELFQAELNLFRADLGMRLAIGRTSALRDQSKRLLAQQAEAEQLTFNVQRARNDPNVRIFKNTAVKDADKSFYDALADVYRATRMVEYYTQQSYPEFDRLFLARMVGRGEFSLENYLFDLQRTYRDFEEDNGMPSLRVARVSLKDHIFAIPEHHPSGLVMNIAERTAQFRERLADPNLLDGEGTLTIPFTTGSDLVSPLTAIHKIDHIEVNIAGNGGGDRTGRVYLSQRGSGLVHSLEGDRAYYTFPPIKTVVNTYFAGIKIPLLDQDIYTDARLRDRPLFNTLWTLGINTTDEAVNRDFKLGEFDDVEIYIFYRDFSRSL